MIRKYVFAATLIAALSSPASAEKLSKQFKKYMALPPQHFVDTATVQDDNLETTAVITTQKGFAITQGLLKIVNNDAYFRAFIDKKTGYTRFQLYHILTYVGDWAFFEQVNYEGVTEVQTKSLDVISRDVGTCNQFFGCFKSEIIAFDVEEATLRRVAAGYDASGQGTSGWIYRLKSKTGVNRDEGLSPAEAAGILAAVKSYRTKLGYQ